MTRHAAVLAGVLTATPAEAHQGHPQSLTPLLKQQEPVALKKQGMSDSCLLVKRETSPDAYPILGVSISFKFMAKS